jgi:hypothetical protein
MGKYSRDKGKRGELDMAHKLGGKRVGVAYLKNPIDVQTQFACYQVKNKAVGSGAILEALDRLRRFAPESNLYVLFKPRRGEWLVAETLEQHQLHHGEFPKEKVEAHG